MKPLKVTYVSVAPITADIDYEAIALDRIELIFEIDFASSDE